jgi:hypothetical protein
MSNRVDTLASASNTLRIAQSTKETDKGKCIGWLGHFFIWKRAAIREQWKAERSKVLSLRESLTLPFSRLE